MKTVLGIELGSTRIKAVAIDGTYAPVSSGDYTWASSYENGVWTYDLNEVWKGLKIALSGVENRENISAMGVSAMMHGYLAFDKDWNLLAPFRTWQNTITGQAAEKLTALFGFNIPQRWSIAHLYQEVLNGEAHVGRIAHITTLAGYVHYMLTPPWQATLSSTICGSLPSMACWAPSMPTRVTTCWAGTLTSSPSLAHNYNIVRIF